MKMKNNLKCKQLICGLFILLSLKVYGQLFEGDKFEYNEANGYFSMSYIDTVKIIEFSEDTTESIKALDFKLTKTKTGEMMLSFYPTYINGDNFRILVKYMDNTIADSKTNENIFYHMGYNTFIHNFISKPILKIRINGEPNFSYTSSGMYDFTGFIRTNSKITEFSALSYKQLNNKYNKQKDIYDGF